MAGRNCSDRYIGKSIGIIVQIVSEHELHDGYL